MIIVDAVVLAILIFVLFNIDEEYGNYAGYIAAAIIMISLYMNIKIHFGSYRGYIRGDNLTRFYKGKKKKFEKVQKKYERGKIDDLTFLEAQKSFDQSIAQIAVRITSLGK